ncbi:zeta-crystallin-like isoform X2 [Bacillus rossius redtenbacheri]
MKAVCIHKFGGPEVLQLETTPVPAPGDDEVLIRIHAAGINPVDTYIRAGSHVLTPPLPAVLGFDVAGVVQQVGDSVTKFKEGDRVFGGLSKCGGYAEYAVSNVKKLYPLSENLSFSQGAALHTPYFTAYRALVTKCCPKEGETVLVHGASGGVGMAAVQIAKSLGLTVVGTAGSTEGMELVKKLGADHVFNHREKGYLNNAVAAVNCRGFDVVIENLANVNLGADFTVLNHNGRIAVVGSRGTVEVNPRSLMITEGSVHGVMLSQSTEEEEEEAGKVLMYGIEDGWVKPVIAREYTLEQAAQAHLDIIENPGATGKLVFTV